MTEQNNRRQMDRYEKAAWKLLKPLADQGRECAELRAALEASEQKNADHFSTIHRLQGERHALKQELAAAIEARVASERALAQSQSQSDLIKRVLEGGEDALAAVSGGLQPKTLQQPQRVKDDVPLEERMSAVLTGMADDISAKHPLAGNDYISETARRSGLPEAAAESEEADYQPPRVEPLPNEEYEEPLPEGTQVRSA